MAGWTLEFDMAKGELHIVDDPDDLDDRPSTIVPRSIFVRMSRSRRAGLGAAVMITILIAAVAAPWVAPHDPNRNNITARLLPPSWVEEGPHFLGTDSLGRDILSRVLHGSRVSLIVGTVSVFAAGSVGVLLGLLAGFYRGWVDSLIMRVVDVWLAIPFLVLAIAVAAVLGPSLQNVIIVLAITGWVIYARVIRAQVLAIMGGGYVESARAIGAGDWRILTSHILPNLMSPIIVLATLEMARMITAEAGLSFLGLGVPPPAPSWGAMVAEGKDVVSIAWWLSVFPGLAIMLTVLSANVLGDWLRDEFDPRLQA